MSLDAANTATGTDHPPMPVEPTTRVESLADPAVDGDRRRKQVSRFERDTQRWSRLIHVYASMIALLVVLFFAVTGITLNHPEWTFGDDVDTETVSGAFPFDTELVTDDGTSGGVDFLSISEYVRDTYDVRGSVDSFDVTNGQGSIVYKNPGYSANLFFDADAGTFDLTVEQQGWVAVMNDLHKGRDTGSAWKWVIDVAAGFLVVVSLTGLVMQFFLRKRRRSALVVAGVGAALTIVFVVVAIS
jgi:uncharacterized protein